MVVSFRSKLILSVVILASIGCILANKRDVGSALAQKLNILASKCLADNDCIEMMRSNFSNTSQVHRHKRLVDSGFCPKVAISDCNTWDAIHIRRPDGACNNLQPGKTWWGMAETAFVRLLPQAYSDGIGAPRKNSILGGLLPNSRKVALDIHFPDDEVDIEWTSLFAFFGQFIDHDITLTAATSDGAGGDLSCTSCNSPNKDCLKIATPAGDTINSDQACMATPRSAATISAQSCSMTHREQMNLHTPWIDMGQVYGKSKKESDSLRSFNSGLLTNSLENLLPLNTAKDGFVAGDVRVNENMGLQGQQIMWMRQHNNVAKALRVANPIWNDEDLFQEASRIVIAQFEHIIYNEFLPQVISFRWMSIYGLTPKPLSDGIAYNQNINPQIYNEFSTAAFRFGHGMVPSVMHKVDRQNVVVPGGTYSMLQALNPVVQDHTNGGYDAIARGCLFDAIDENDRHLVDAIENHLFETKVAKGDLPAADGSFNRQSLATLNIERGREHGIAGYTVYRNQCFGILKKVNNWADLVGIMTDETIGLLKSTYASVHDIDLFTGGLSEIQLESNGAQAAVGDTFACIIGKQFQALKYGDRHFYETTEPETKFTSQQLKAIKSTTFAALLCDTAQIDKIQPDVFRVSTFPTGIFGPNGLRACSTYPRMDLSPWIGIAPHNKNPNGGSGPQPPPPPPPPPRG